MRRYQNFSNDHNAIVSNVDTVILTNRTFFGWPKDWCCDELAKKSDPIMKVFHVSLCKKSRKMAATTVWSYLSIMRGVHEQMGSLPRKSSIVKASHMDLS